MITPGSATQLAAPVAGLLTQLQRMLEHLTEEQYCRRIKVLSHATLGQHTRHIIECFLELDAGYASGEVNYDQRKRDHRIETSRSFAINRLGVVIAQLEKADKPLRLVIDYSHDGEAPGAVTTSYHRELVHNLEHAVHHMALLRIGVNAVSALVLPPDFGVAMSTLKYRNACVQ
ncbi:DinB family protein [Chitinophaga japonensis]|uniref:DinB family protein n=1 Tax=Chitinophaga japonensis TaxID=104662 RepID=A0A562T2M4_CHIJA|nr:DinB family protein [Chitinophaga japonensis]TWI87887.1 hypothetical protein LX66_1961 [Chitinophaga japonensis]